MSDENQASAGPFKLTGNITLIDENGEVTHANHLTLCRCGASKNKPHCDDQHLEIEFFDMGNIHRASDCMPVTRPQTVTVIVSGSPFPGKSAGRWSATG